VVGSLTPQLYGSGSEDFYNGGFYFLNGPFTLPVHGYPMRVSTPRDATAVYRFLLSDLIPFTTSIKVGLEHDRTNDGTPDYYSVAFYYKSPQPMATLRDTFDVGNAGSESTHNYTIGSATWSGTTSGYYEGDNDDVLVSEDGRRHTGYSQFTAAISSANDGLLLRRRMDYSIARQNARVYVDGVLAGSWYEAGSNTSKKFRDSEFMLPASLTQGKSSVTIRLENDSTESAWSEYLYWVYALQPQAPPPPPQIALNVSSINHTVVKGHNLANDTFTVTNTGGGSLNYNIAVNATWLNVTPSSGTNTGTPDTITITYDTTDLAAGDYAATIEVTASGVSNSPQSIAEALHVKQPGDLDGDLDVDQTDFGLFQVCLGGPMVPYPPGCQSADLNSDGDVDDDDLNVVQGCMAGPGRPPGC